MYMPFKRRSYGRPIGASTMHKQPLWQVSMRQEKAFVRPITAPCANSNILKSAVLAHRLWLSVFCLWCAVIAARAPIKNRSTFFEIGRASCRERVEISGGEVSRKKKRMNREGRCRHSMKKVNG